MSHSFNRKTPPDVRQRIADMTVRRRVRTDAHYAQTVAAMIDRATYGRPYIGADRPDAYRDALRIRFGLTAIPNDADARRDGPA